MFDVQREEGVTTIRLAHGKVNALDLELLIGLTAAIEEVARGDDALILTGTGRSFSAGVDLVRLMSEGRAYVERFVPALTTTLEALFFLENPTIAAINGHAIAGGHILAAACDVRVAAYGAGRMGVPELRVGVPFPAIALEILRHATPPVHFYDLVYGGESFALEEAGARGLVDVIVEQEGLLAEAERRARSLSQIPAQTFQVTKRQLRRPVRVFLDQNSDLEEAGRELWASEDITRGIAAYLARTLGKG